MKIKTFIKGIKYIPAWLVYKHSTVTVIREELNCWCKSLRIENISEFDNFLFLMGLPEYRSELFWRLGSKARVLRIITPPIQLYTLQRHLTWWERV